MNQNQKIQATVSGLVAFVAAVLIAAAVCSCAVLVQSAEVAGATVAGAGIGFVAGGPPGAVAGGGIGAATAHALIEASESQKRLDAYQSADKPSTSHSPPPSGPPSFLGIAWYWWALILYALYRNRAHLIDMLSKSGGRWDAILRAVGWRTHRSKGAA